jgi:hypothetical protein
MATISEVLGTDSWNEGRVKFNTSIDNVNDDLIDVIADLVAHKAGDDHASVYAALAHNHEGVYAEVGEVVDRSTAQDIGGAKNFLSELSIQKSTPDLLLKNASGTSVARIIAITDTTLALQVYDTGTASFKTQLLMDVTTGKLSNNSGGELVDKNYVQARVRSGFFMIDVQRTIATRTNNTTYPVTDAQGTSQRFLIPNGAVLKKITTRWFLASPSTESEELSEDFNVSFSTGGYQWITVDMVTGTDDRAIDLKVYAWKMVTGAATATLLTTTIGYVTDGGFGNNTVLLASLEFSL